MSQNSKTSGGVGTNQYQVRGQSQGKVVPPEMAPWQVLVQHGDQQAVEPVLWDLLMRYGNRTKLAAVSGLPVEVLSLLARDQDIQVRTAAAGNPQCPAEVLEELAGDPVLQPTVMKNPNTPPKVLDEYAGNFSMGSDWHVVVISNPNCPAVTLRRLIDTYRPGYEPAHLITALHHPNCPIDVITTNAYHRDHAVRAAVASNPACPAALLGRLAKDGSANVRIRVATHLNTPPEALAWLVAHKRDNVRIVALANPNCPDYVRVVATLGA